MKQMIISVSPLGEVNHTLKDNFFKPDFGAKRNVQRMSEIVHETELDRFYVQRMDGVPFKVDEILRDLDIKRLKKNAWYDLIGNNLFGFEAAPFIIHFPGVTPTFGTYEEAVAFEVRLIDAYRLAGKPIPGFSSEA